MKNRPRRLLSDDGQRVLNIWFIPHFTEVLGVFRKLDDRIARTALSHYAKIAGVLHDVLHYFCAFSTLGTNTNKKQHNSISATWGGNEGIGKCHRIVGNNQPHIDSYSMQSSFNSTITARYKKQARKLPNLGRRR